jgi:hypothetical protein
LPAHTGTIIGIIITGITIGTTIIGTITGDRMSPRFAGGFSLARIALRTATISRLCAFSEAHWIVVLGLRCFW